MLIRANEVRVRVIPLRRKLDDKALKAMTKDPAGAVNVLANVSEVRLLPGINEISVPEDCRIPFVEDTKDVFTEKILEYVRIESGKNDDGTIKYADSITDVPETECEALINDCHNWDTLNLWEEIETRGAVRIKLERRRNFLANPENRNATKSAVLSGSQR